MGRMRITYLTGYLSPHLLPLLNAVGAHPDIDLVVWYCQGDIGLRGWEHDLRPTHDYVISRRSRWTWIHPEFHLDPAVRGFLKDHPADLAIVSDYSIPTLRLAIGWLNRRRRPWVLAGERPFLWQASLSRALLGTVMRHRPLNSAKAVIAKGSLNAEIYRELCPWGMPIHAVPYCLDAATYRGSREEGLRIIRERTGDAPGKEDFVFVFTGSLIRRKGVLLLVEAFAGVAACEPRARLVVMGDGPLRNQMAQRLGTAMQRVFFLGNIPYREAPSVYRTGHAFVFPTQHDGWGMAVNEAMASELPVITTNACGAARELVSEGDNGWVLPPWDGEALREQMLTLARNPVLAARMGRRSREIMNGHTPRHGAERMYAACRAILEGLDRAKEAGGCP